jgi:hypothetical protein
MVDVRYVSATGQITRTEPLYSDSISEDEIAYQNPLYEEYYPFIYYSELIYRGKSAWWIPTISGSDNLGLWDATLAKLMLPQFEKEAIADYKGRLARSRWQPFYADTIKGISGLLTNFSIKPDTLSYFKDEQRSDRLNDVDMEGSSLSAFFLSCDCLALRDGFCAVLVQRPVKPESVITAAQKNMMNLRTYLVVYERSRVINWEYGNDKKTLVRLILEREDYRTVGTYQQEKYKEYIEITPDEYLIWSIEEDGKKNKAVLSDRVINELGYIPVVFYAVNTKNPFCLMPPLYAIAENNVHHYQVYSDYRETLHFLAHPIIVRKGLIQNVHDRESAPPLILGSKQVQDVPENGDITVVTIPQDGATLNRDGAQEIKADILEQIFGFVGNTQSTMTATEAGLRATTTQANLKIYASQKESAIEEIFAIWSDYDRQERIRGQGILLNKSIFQILTPQMIGEYKDLLINNYLDLQSFWEIMGQVGGLPEGTDPSVILERLGASQEFNNNAPR